MIKTFVFMDSETTGLPYYEHNKTRITELCLISAQADHISLGVIPRVQNKLNLCFNPMKLINHDAAKLTGLYNDDLESESSFDELSFDLLIHFLERLTKPICLVAHNGYRFDYPILRNHIELIGKSFSDDIACIDSLVAFRDILTRPESHAPTPQSSTSCQIDDNSKVISDEWDDIIFNEVEKIEETLSKSPSKSNSRNQQLLNETTPSSKKDLNMPGAPRKNRMSSAQEINKPAVQKKLNFGDKKLHKQSFKLVDVYERLTGKEPINAHHAEADVQMLLQCAVHLGDTFIFWANENAIVFNQVPKMEPGKKIGLAM